MTTEYRAVEDIVGAFVPTTAKRRCIVIRYVNGKFGWVCGAFSKMPVAEKRAAELNAAEKAT